MAAPRTGTAAPGALKSALVSTKPHDSIKVATAAISTLGSFFGYAGTFDTVARENTRAMPRPIGPSPAIITRSPEASVITRIPPYRPDR